MDRLVSLIIAIAYLIIAVIAEGLFSVLPVLALVGGALACIWFGDELGSFTGWIEFRRIGTPTPGIIIKIFGWFLLIAPIILFAKTLITKQYN